jgi:hypothetical protein
LASAVIGGNVGPASWNVANRAGVITVKGAVNGWGLDVAGSIKSLNLGDVADAGVSAGASVGSVRARKWDAGQLVAGSIGSLTVNGNLGADVTLTGAGVAAGKPVLSTATVSGTVRGSTISVAGPVNSFSAHGFADSALLVGFTPGNASDPFAGGTFAPGARVNAFRVTGAFDNGIVAATDAGAVVLKAVVADNAGRAFGLLVDGAILSLAVATPPLTLTNITADPALPATLADFRVRVA